MPQFLRTRSALIALLLVAMHIALLPQDDIEIHRLTAMHGLVCDEDCATKTSQACTAEGGKVPRFTCLPLSTDPDAHGACLKDGVDFWCPCTLVKDGNYAGCACEFPGDTSGILGQIGLVGSDIYCGGAVWGNGGMPIPDTCDIVACNANNICEQHSTCLDGQVCNTDSELCYEYIDHCELNPTLPSCNASSSAASAVSSSSGCTENADCDDGNACTVDECENGTCNPSPSAVMCDDQKNCTTNTCNPQTGCVYAPMNCSDSCTACREDSGACLLDPATTNPYCACKNPSLQIVCGVGVPQTPATCANNPSNSACNSVDPTAGVICCAEGACQTAHCEHKMV